MMVSKDVISPLCMEYFVWKSMQLLCALVPIRKRLVGFDCDGLVLVLEMIGMVGILLGLVVGAVS